jgi:hypothetical protein
MVDPVSKASTTRNRLDSWKEIATYIGRDIRTAMRWEKERGLPVHRVPGNGSRQPVFAYQTELDEWLKQKGDAPRAAETQTETHEPNSPARESELGHSAVTDRYSLTKKIYFMGSIAVTLIVATLVVVWHRPVSHDPALIVRIQFGVFKIRALDNAGRVLWTHQLSRPIHSEALKHPELVENLVRIADLYGDSGREALVTVPLERSADHQAESFTEIDCFSNAGKLLWSYIPHEKFRFGSFDLDGPWFVEDVFLSRGVKPTIWVALTNNWGNSFVVQLDPSTGKDTVRFVNTGIIYKLNQVAISAQTYLLIGGFNNEYAAGMLAAVDENKAYSVSPQTLGTRHKCVSCGEGAPDYYFVFPRSEINRLYKAWEDSVRFIDVHDHMVEVGKSALGDPALGSNQDVGKVDVVYDFRIEPDLRPFAFRFDSWYDMAHLDLQSKGKLEHGIDSCPERLHPDPIRLWTSAGGWSQISLNRTAP